MRDPVDALFDAAKVQFRKLLQSHTGTGAVTLFARKHQPSGTAKYEEDRVLFFATEDDGMR